jgi:hypothetical protein
MMRVELSGSSHWVWSVCDDTKEIEGSEKAITMKKEKEVARKGKRGRETCMV